MPTLRLDSILALAISLSVAGCGGGAIPTTFDLSAPGDFGKLKGTRAAVVVNEPTTVQALDSDRVIVEDSSGALTFLGGAQWAHRVPKLVQTRLIQTIENGSRIASVSRPGERIVPDYQLNTDIRAFNIEAASRSAIVEISAKNFSGRGCRGPTTARGPPKRLTAGYLSFSSRLHAGPPDIIPVGRTSWFTPHRRRPANVGSFQVD